MYKSINLVFFFFLFFDSKTEPTMYIVQYKYTLTSRDTGDQEPSSRTQNTMGRPLIQCQTKERQVMIWSRLSRHEKHGLE